MLAVFDALMSRLMNVAFLSILFLSITKYIHIPNIVNKQVYSYVYTEMSIC